MSAIISLEFVDLSTTKNFCSVLAGQIRMNGWPRRRSGGTGPSNAFKIRADIFFPTLCRITWYHWPTFFCFVLWHDDEATTEGGLCLGILRRQARVSRARFHVGSSIFASSSNTGMKSLEALNWELLPNPESVGALFTVSCMQASSRFLKIVTDHITSAQYQFVWCDLFWYNRLNVLLAKKKSSEFLDDILLKSGTVRKLHVHCTFDLSY